MEIVITIISGFYILFLPGFFLSFIFFKPGKIDIMERLALSFGLSITIIPTIAFYSSLVHIPLTTFTVMVMIAGCILFTGIILLIQYFTHRI